MTTKLSMAGLSGLGGAHTAGIYADMTVDGPEIGDLVVILDKAKNLPNRKTIGKQDPYCAARLGKEAKKTETDKRGGQTPRWDQEVRFTVHDSADYRQLKVSVFNDDKKTDLIGECWVGLDDVLSRGGGRSDGWHTLNCKGKYAGEIRIEITYYDTRPKEERPAEVRRESGKSRPQQGPRESLGGPRQLKPVVRRPLPADPVQPASGTASDVFAPQPLRPTPPRVQPQPLARQAPPAAHFADPPAQQQVHRYEPHEPSNSHLVLQAPSAVEAPYIEDRPAETSQRYAGRREQTEIYAPVAEEGNPMLRRPEYRAAPQYPDEQESRQPLSDYSRQPVHHGQAELHSEPPPPRTAHQMTPDAPAPLSIAKGTDYGVDAAPPMRHYHSAPDPRILTGQPMAYPPREERFEAYQPTDDDAQHNMAPRRQPYVSDYEDEYVEAHFDEPEDIPPPPPAHRSSDAQPTHPRMPARPVRGQTMPAEPSTSAYTRDLRHIAQVQHTSHAPYATSPLSGGSALGHSPTAYQQPQPQPQRQPRRSPAGSFSEIEPDMPLSLVPGYDPRAAVDHPARARRETMDDVRWDGSPSHAAPVAASHRTYRPYVPPPEPSEPSPPLHHEEAGFQRPARASVSAAAVAAVAAAPPAPSAEPMRLPRKSVSPRPPSERNGIAQTPFSPDAFDVLNPHANTTSINDPGPQYRTPEEADVVARDLQRGQTNEPIIAPDGRLIDPSDHLPTSTWAPEPERKTPMKSAASSLDLRSRPSPQGAQPMPPSTRRAARESASRPHSIAGSPVYAYGGDAGGTSPYAAENHNATNPRRIRIQMKPRGQTSSVASTPVSTPQVAYGNQGHSYSHGTPRSIPKMSATDRDRDRDRDRDEWATPRRSSPSCSPYGSHNANGSIHSQGMSHAGSPGAGAPPPPIPAKVPISSTYSTNINPNTINHAGAHEEYSALSEELRTINIGSTGRRVARRSYY